MDERCIHRESIISNCSAIMVHALDLRFYDTSQNYSRSANLYTFWVDRTYFDIVWNNLVVGHSLSIWNESLKFCMNAYDKKSFLINLCISFIFKIQLMWVKIMRNLCAQNGLGFRFWLIIKCLKHLYFILLN